MRSQKNTFYISSLFPGVVVGFSSEEEEKNLTFRAFAQNDRDALDELILAYRPYVETKAKKFAQKFFSARESSDEVAKDLFNEGMIGCMIAAQEFDLAKGVRFITFARQYILKYMHNYTRLNASNIYKPPEGPKARKAYFKLRKIRAQENIPSGRAFNTDEVKAIAAGLEVSAEDVRIVDEYMLLRVQSFDAPLSDNGLFLGDSLDRLGDSGLSVEGSVASDAPSPEDIVLEDDQKAKFLGFVQAAIELLDPRSQDIFTRRRLSEDRPLLEEVGLVHGVSRARVDQLEKLALDFVTRQARALANGTTLAELMVMAGSRKTKRKVRSKPPSSSEPNLPQPPSAYVELDDLIAA